MDDLGTCWRKSETGNDGEKTNIYIYNIYINIVRIPEKDGKQERGRERDKVIYGQLDSLGTHLDMLELYGLKQHVLARFGTRI